ncbi:MAG: GTP cyclohydrolase, FolE2/MptA family, partial [Gammaproteobacteria bacterium]|nr:GTP cyclohydrolase, FolE2/MptA family [Gammaproteobacteria bacterium]
MKFSQPQPKVASLPPDRHDIPDVQASADLREIDIQRVGIKDLRHPLLFVDRSGTQVNTVAHASMTVHLPKEYKGTHMSRFVELLNQHQEPLSIGAMQTLVEHMNRRLQARAGHIQLTFPYFVRKRAPVSGVESL